MITKPSIDQLTAIAKNKYVLCIAISKKGKRAERFAGKR